MKKLIVALILAWLSLDHAANDNWRSAYEAKISQVVYISHGTLRHNPAEKHHVIIGYDVENCSIDAPDGENVMAGVNITVVGRQAYGISIGEPPKPKERP